MYKAGLKRNIELKFKKQLESNNLIHLAKKQRQRERLMNPIFITAIQILQNFWWIIFTLVIIGSEDFFICLLSSLSIFFRSLSVIMKRRKNIDERLLFLTLLANNVCYTEANIIFANKNSFLNHINTLIILFNYQEGRRINSIESLNLLFDYAFPTYFLVRQISLIFIKFDIQLCEGSVILALILFSSFASQGKQQLTTKSCTKQDNSLQPQTSMVKLDKQKEFRQTISSSKFQIVDKGQQFPTNIQINIKDSYREESAPIPCFHSKLKPVYKSQFSHLVIDKSDSQLQNFYQNLVNVLPQGVIMINKFQQIQYMSYKCEKLVECEGKDKVIEYIRKCVSNCELPEEIHSMTKLKSGLTQRMLEEIIRIYRQNQQDLDVFDVLLNPKKYITAIFPNQGSSEFEKSSQGSLQYSALSAASEHSYCFECNIERQDEDQSKRLKFILIQTEMTNAQQEAISQQGLSNYNKKSPTLGNNEISQPFLLILIKNVTHKYKVQALKQETIINNSLLKSFSHELRTPLNSCQHMLNIIKDLSKDKQILQYLSIAHSSIKLLIHQINDILDFSAIQSKTFSYHTTTFSIEDLIEEIHELYCQQVQQKNIKFEVKCDKQLQNQFFINDKQRIMQVLVNLLNNSCKYTKMQGQVVVSFRQKKGNLIKVSVKDDGIGIKQHKLKEIKKYLCKPCSKLSSDQITTTTCLGLGLNISAKLIQGLAYGNNLLDVKSNDQQGTKVIFFFQKQEIMNNECLLSPMPSYQTGRFEINSPAPSILSQRMDMSLSIQHKSAFLKIESPQNESTLFKDHVESPRLNDQQSSQVVIPTSCYNFKQKIYQQHSSLLSFQVNTCKQDCTQCTHILIVDDVPFNQIAFTSMLNHLSIKSDSAYDGYQAVELVKIKLTQHCKYYKIIFMDIEMPGQDGFQTSRTITQIPNMQSTIVMCSAYDTIENYNLALRAGITEFLPKPVNKKDLDKILKKYQLRI